jgi:branched-chain amino acid transport system substrate-binding protein
VGRFRSREEAGLGINRTNFLRTAAGAAAGAAVAATASPWRSEAEAAMGSSVFVGLLCPITGSYGADGKDEERGYELAIEDLNNGTGVMAKIPSLAGKKGLLGKTITYKVGDTQIKPDLAVQLATNFITENKAVMITGGVSSAEDIAVEKLAQQQRTLYMVGASGSNDTTGIDCQRYAFRSQLDAYMVAKSLDPYLVKAYGKGRKMAFLTPDYSYGHSLTNSMRADLEKRGWTTAINVVAPFPITDYSSYLTNIANTDADVFINIEFGNDGITSTKQAIQFGIMKKMKLVIPNISTYLPDGLGPEIMQGVYGTQDWYYTLQDRFPLSKVFVESFMKKFPGIIPRWTAHIAYAQTAIWADAVAHAKTFDPVPVIKYLEKGNKVDLMLGPVYYRAGDHQQVRPCPVVIGKAPAMMKNKDDFFNVVALVPGAQVMQPLNETGCKMPPYT